MPLRLFAALAVLCLSACASTRGNDVSIPHLANLKSHATESFDFKLGPVRLALARWLVGMGHDADAAEVRETLKACTAVRVRHYEFASGFEYPVEDIDAIRAHLSGHGWSSMVTVRDRKAKENTDVFIRLDHEKITGLFVLNSEPREFTLVSVVGSFDPTQIDRLRTQFGSHAHGRRAAADVQRTSIVTPANSP